MRPGDIVRKYGDKDVRSVDELQSSVTEGRARGDQGAMVLMGGPNGTRWIAFSVKE